MGLPVDGMRAVIPNISHLRSVCHELNVPVFYLRLGWNEDYSDSGILLDAPPASAVKDLGGLVRGTWDTAIVDGLTPDSTKDIVIDKTRNSGFWGTNFSEQLAKREVNQLIIAGVGSNVCVECTARDSFQNGIHTVTVSDATGTVTQEAHNATMESLLWFGGTATTEEVQKALRAL